jgi:DNA-binding NarL/FixJ family response regulator
VIAQRACGSELIGRDERLLLERRARGEALKVIAADLGISVSCASRRLTRALRRLGLRSHTDLARLFCMPEASK